MTLFIKMPRRSFEISDLYIMALSFILFYAVTRITVRVVEKCKQKNWKNTKIPNPKGGGIEIEGVTFTDESELGLAILSCIANDHSYIVKHPTIKKVIFELVKENILNESLAITPNLMRYFATRLLKKDSILITQIGNIVVQSESRSRFFTRIISSAIAGTVSAFGIPFMYGVFLSLMVFLNTENCFVKCDQYFEPIPQERGLNFYEESESNHLFVTDENKQVAIYTPASKEVEVTLNGNAEPVVKKMYKKIPKKAKQVKFSDFRKTDPELSKFNKQELVEPSIPQNKCKALEAMKAMEDSME